MFYGYMWGSLWQVSRMRRRVKTDRIYDNLYRMYDNCDRVYDNLYKLFEKIGSEPLV